MGKFVITESQYEKVMYDFITSYVNDTFDEMKADYKDSFIIIWNPNIDIDDVDGDLVLFEYDSWDNRLYISKDYIKTIRHFIPVDISYIYSIIKDLFENRFDVKIESVVS
jgi:hypothetical protein